MLDWMKDGIKMKQFKVGDEVYWNDPEEETSDYYVIEEINGEIFLLVNENSEVQAFEHELD